MDAGESVEESGILHRFLSQGLIACCALGWILLIGGFVAMAGFWLFIYVVALVLDFNPFLSDSEERRKLRREGA